MEEYQGFAPEENPDREVSQKNLITSLFICEILKGLEEMEDDLFKVDGKAVDKIQVLGQIVNYEQENKITIIYLDDGTGILQMLCIKKYDEDKPDVLQEIEYEEFPYVSAVLQLINNSGAQKANFSVMSFQKISHLNMITFHNFSCLKSLFLRYKSSKSLPQKPSLPLIKDDILQFMLRAKQSGRSCVSLKDLLQNFDMDKKVV